MGGDGSHQWSDSEITFTALVFWLLEVTDRAGSDFTHGLIILRESFFEGVLWGSGDRW